jgi:rhodanese-related sulfurtransferase
MTDATSPGAELTVERAREMIEAGEATAVDVRQDYEWEAGHIAGAIHVPLEQLPARAGELDRERPLIMQCRTGSRSAMATAALREAGFEALNLEGGLQAWVEAGLPIEPADGKVATARPDNT